jgi:hypothetical protein
LIGNGSLKIAGALLRIQAWQEHEKENGQDRRQPQLGSHTPPPETVVQKDFYFFSLGDPTTDSKTLTIIEITGG